MGRDGDVCYKHLLTRTVERCSFLLRKKNRKRKVLNYISSFCLGKTEISALIKSQAVMINIRIMYIYVVLAECIC